MKNIHVLPTDKSSRLYLNSENKIFITDVEMKCGNTQNIYITSDEEIKIGDWVYCLREGFEPILKQKVNTIGVNNDEMMKKIILTTDPDLIKDGVQAIDDEFLEWFVKNPSCEFADVNDWLDDNGNIGGNKRYQICNHITKEEPKQTPQLNISDVRRSFSFTYDDLKTSFEEGWKDYSNNWYGGRDKGEPQFDVWFDEWFKKNYV